MRSAQTFGWHFARRRASDPSATIYADVPETIRLREKELTAEERRLANFVGEGRGSRELGKALVETERPVEALRVEVEGLRRSREKVFQALPIEWIEDRLGELQKLLERSTEKSAKLLRRLLGPIRLEPQKVDIGRPYYVARTALNALVLMEKPLSGEGPEGGSNSLALVEAVGIAPSRAGVQPAVRVPIPTPGTHCERSERLVEAVGIEPTSGKRVPRASTCISSVRRSRRIRCGQRQPMHPTSLTV